MNENMTRKKEISIFTALFIILTSLLIGSFVLKGKSLVLIADPFDQNLPIFIYLGKCLQEMIISGGELRLYDFTIGLGENVIAPLNLYGFGDPLNLFSIFVTAGNAELLFVSLIFLRMYLSGLGFLTYARKHGHSGYLPVGGALMYALSLYAIMRGIHFYSLLNAMYLLPFLLILLEDLIDAGEQRRYAAAAKFALLIMVQTCCSFYFLYLQTIFLVIYAFVYYCKVYGAEETIEDNALDWEQVALNFESDWGNIQREGNYLEADGGDTLTLTVDAEGLDDTQGELYVFFKDFQCFRRWTSQIEINGWEFSVQNRTSPYYTGAEDFLVHVSVPKDGKIEILFRNENQFELHDISVYWYDYKGLEKDVEALREYSLQNVKLGKNRVDGDIKAKDGWLFLSIPYSSEWRAYVDGEETKIVKANVGFMAVRLDEGEHHVEFVYRSPAFTIGVICTIIGFAVILCFFHLERRKNR